MVVHVALLGLLRLTKILIHILDVYERPGEVVSCADASEPGGFGGKSCCAVKISYRFLNARELIHIVDGFIWVEPAKKLGVLQDCGGGGNCVDGAH